MLYSVTYCSFNRHTGEVKTYFKVGTCKNRRYDARMKEYKNYILDIERIGTKGGSYKTEKRMHAKLLRLGYKKARDDENTEWFIIPYNVTPETVSAQLGFTPCKG